MKNCTKMDINIQMELNKITSRKSKIRLTIIGLSISLCGLYVYTFDDVFGYGLIYGGIAVIIIFDFLINWNKFLLKKTNNSHLLKGETFNYFEFKEDKIIVNTIRDSEESGYTKINYTDLIKVLENKDCLFLYISNFQAYVFYKNNMTEGTIEDLVTLLKSKVQKYKVI